ncbi:transposase [Clostridioides difficile]|nr:transposase [Clostridioides difficile]
MGRHLWNHSYFVATVSENTEEQIRKYIKYDKIIKMCIKKQLE